MAAPQYIDYVMTFTQRTVSDETIFPTKYGKRSYRLSVKNGRNSSKHHAAVQKYSIVRLILFSLALFHSEYVVNTSRVLNFTAILTLELLQHSLPTSSFNRDLNNCTLVVSMERYRKDTLTAGSSTVNWSSSSIMV